MDNVLGLLIYSFFLRLFLFFRHWYFAGNRRIVRLAISLLEILDSFFAIKITVRHLFSPLYQDRSVLGYILGIPTRFFLLLVGGSLYLIISIICLAICLLWSALPLVALFYALSPLLTF